MLLSAFRYNYSTIVCCPHCRELKSVSFATVRTRHQLGSCQNIEHYNIHTYLLHKVTWCQPAVVFQLYPQVMKHGIGVYLAVDAQVFPNFSEILSMTY